uniref:polysaccharide biosynthesis/export family protein n=1 Tax=Sphingomonas sp. TaxID=28214 RepID=UPI0025E8AD85
SRELVVDGSGHVGLPLIGEVDAQGQTPVTLAAQITERFRARFVRNPRVSVNIIDAVSQVITLDGEIRAPGLYPVVGKLTLIRAIAQAKGMTENARIDQVVVFRTVKGQRLAALFDLQAIRQGTYADPEVYANDVVVVGDSPARRLFRNLLAASPLLTTPLVILSNRL